MTLVNITLTEDEQEFVIALSGKGDVRYLHPHFAVDIAEKIRRARTSDMFEIYPPVCAICLGALERVDVHGPGEYVHAGDEPPDRHAPQLTQGSMNAGTNP